MKKALVVYGSPRGEEGPGKCAQTDDMAGVLPKFRDADIIVFGTPVYVDGMPGPLKTMVDRLLPLVQPMTVFQRAIESVRDQTQGKQGTRLGAAGICRKIAPARGLSLPPRGVVRRLFQRTLLG